jgi:hypothetical protein
LTSEDCRSRIPDSTLLVRSIRGRDINRQTRAIKKSAFLPRRNGNDNDGLSVSEARSETVSQLVRRVASKEGIFCSLIAGGVRAISVETITLDVCPDPTETDPYHALIKNIPTDQQTWVITERFAELLAKASDHYALQE